MSFLSFRIIALAAISLLSLHSLAPGARADGTLIPLPTRSGMIFDSAGRYLYISTTDGYVRRYDLVAGEIDRSYNLGGSLKGLDIAVDDSFLVVAQGSVGLTQGAVQRLNLATGAITTSTYPLISGEAGAWEVAITGNGKALFTSAHPGSGAVPLRQLDLATNIVTERPDAPGYAFGGRIYGATQLLRSADRQTVYLLGGHSDGRVFSYESSGDSFRPSVSTGYDLDYASVAIDPSGSLLASRLGNRIVVDAVPGYCFRRSIRGPNSGVAFAEPGRLYAIHSAAADVVGYDTGTFAELFRLPVGEVLPTVPTPFASGTMVASPDGRYLAVRTGSGVRLLTVPAQPPPAAAEPPSFGTPRGMVFDHAGERLYITTAEGGVWPYHLGEGTLGTPYKLDGWLNGVDIAADDSYLLVAQWDAGLAQGGFQKVDLKTGAILNLNYARISTSHGGAWDIAIGCDAIALGTTDTSFLGAPLYEVNLASGATMARTDAPGSAGSGKTASRTQLYRSADGSRIYVLESGDSRGRVFTYSATANTFGPWVNTGSYLHSASAAVNRNGNLLAFRRTPGPASLQTAPNFGAVASFSAADSGVAFDATRDLIYGVNSSADQIIAYDTTTYAERFRFDVGENVAAGAANFGRGLLVASHDGRYLALNTGAAVRVYDLPALPLLSVSMLQTHGDRTFALDLPLDGPTAIECRSGGPDGKYTLVFTFGEPLTSVGGSSASGGSGTVTTAYIDPADPRRCIVNLTGVAPTQNLKVTLSELRDVANNHTSLISAQVAVLVGDTNGDRTVNSGDAVQTRSRSGSSADATNYRSDINADGVVNSADALLVRARAGNALP